MSKQALLEKLTNKLYRDAFTSEEIDVGLPMQIRSMREKRDWKQGYVADKLGTKQPRITLMERPGYGNFSLNTLKKLAALFDVGLIVSFVPWSEMIDFTKSISNKRLSIPTFCDEYVGLERRYSRTVRALPDQLQTNFDFSSLGELTQKQFGRVTASARDTRGNESAAGSERFDQALANTFIPHSISAHTETQFSMRAGEQ
jgi:transcriptional regulator with XRE-family HTH domain